MKKKIALLMACVMAFGVAVGGTLAWLTDNTAPVVNTFTDSDINITLTETGATQDGDQWKNSFKMIPGHTITKNPLVTVEDGSEDCYIFVKVVEANNTISGLAADPSDEDSEGKVLLYSVDSAWTPLNGVANVYYQTVTGLTAGANTADWSDYVLVADANNENQVRVNQNVTKEMMNGALTSDKPTLTFKAAAIQLYSTNDDDFSPVDAYANLPDAFKS